jgi:hypothetical protein
MTNRSTPGPLSRLARPAWALVIGAGVLALNLQCATVNALPEKTTSERPEPATQAQIAAPLVQKQDLVYTGAFRVPPEANDRQTYAWGGTALAYWPAHDSLLMVGHDWYQQVGEMSIPTPGGGPTIEDLPRASEIQPLTDVLQGKLKSIDGDIQNGVKIGGLIVTPQSLVVTAWSYYDAGPQKQTKTHFVTGQNFATLTPASVSGPFQVGTGFQNIIRNDASRIAGFVSGYMTPIPKDWQSALGGTHLTGQGGGISILMRTSAGPSASVFTPTDLGSKVPAPAKIVMGYPIDTNDPSSGLHHPELGEWGTNGGLYNGTQAFRGMVFPDGTRSILFVGFGADNFCYGSGTADKSLHLRPVPGAPGVHYCYDPTPGMVGNKGTHGYPISPIVWAYDVNEFIRARNDDKRPWDVKPYATWEFTLPFQSNMQNGIEMGNFEIMGAAYDPVRRRLFVSAYRNDGPSPIVHVFVLKNALTAAE